MELFEKVYSALYDRYRFLNTPYGYFDYKINDEQKKHWIEFNLNVFISKELVFELLSEEDKLVFAFHLDEMDDILSHSNAIKTKKELIAFAKKRNIGEK